jgi:hypothetical protein
VSSFSFIDKIVKQIDRLIEEGNLDKADEEITHFFSVYGNNMELMKKFNKLLGKYNFLRGNRLKSLEYMIQYNKDVPEDFEAAAYIAENLLDVGKEEEAVVHIAKLLNNPDFSSRGKFFYVLYLISVNNIEEATPLYRELHKNKKMNADDYVKLAYYFLLKRKFDNAREVLLNGLSFLKGSTLLQDEFEYLTYIENYYRENIRKYYFGNIDKFTFKPKIYVKSLRVLVESLSLRNYHEEEIELAISILIHLHTLHFSASHSMLAALCDYFLIQFLLDEWEISSIIEKFYGVKLASVKRAYASLENSTILNQFYDKLEEVFKINISDEYE